MMLAAFMVGLSIGVLYVIVPAPIDLVAVQRGLRFGPGAGVAAQFGSMVADGLCAVLALGVLAPLTNSPHLQMPISIVGLAMLALVSVTTVRSLFRASDLTAKVEIAPPPPTPYRVHALWGAVATIASPFPLAYWTSLGATLARFSTPDRWVLGAGFLIVDVTWALGFPLVVAAAPRLVPPALRNGAHLLGGMATLGVACFFSMQLAATVA
jgi:threonine/homoserine/homoserine lactone efflux protein